ncbi:MAG: hypothetical protein CMN05_03675 [Roseibacillus sp.]|nr:hypothetical protein [Roseibacillus sp.]MBP36700.1 hypothetical protein [Roseibacillus sp.]MCP4732329.1 sialate O-acetylesterase [Roseibacillus sp.]MDP7308490.1 sialate O-acetylesterase [Roseibacillus sp.]HJM62928.1 sialate O-acetylesterase [Roseibacillus sp.]
MTNHYSQSHSMRGLICYVALAIFSFVTVSAKNSQRHLFILSGQSNMTGGLKAGFAKTVEDTFGEDNVVVVHHSKSGRGIRFWDKDYRFPDNYRFPGKGVPSERSRQQHGQEYGPLIGKVREAFDGRSFDSVTFVWMQGESDGKRGLGAAYEKSFLRLLGRMKTDLGRKDVAFVIGRINDSYMSEPPWKAMRDVQVKLAEDNEHGEWVDTDDLSEPEHGVHFPRESYPILGRRFAEKAIELIRQTKIKK